MNWALLGNSVLVSTVVAVGATLGGLIVALMSVGLSSRANLLVLVVAALGLIIPPFLVTNAWLYYFGLTGVMRPTLPFNVYSLGGTILLMTLLYWPVSFFVHRAALKKLPNGVLDFDPMLRGPGLVRHALWPSLRGSVGPTLLITFVLAFNNFAIPSVLQVKVLPAELWVRFNTTFDYAGALQLCWPAVLLTAVMLWKLRWNPRWTVAQRDTRNESQLRKRLGNLWWVCATISLCLSWLTLLPLWQLVADSRTWSELGAAARAGQNAILNTLLFAAGGATVALVLGMVLRRATLRRLLWLPFILPGIVTGIFLSWISNQNGFSALSSTVIVVLIAVGFRFAGPVGSLLEATFSRIDRRLIDLARIDGAGFWSRVRFVEMPQVWSGLLAAWFAAFFLIVWDVETILLILPPGRETIAIRIFNLLHYGHNTQVNALCLIVLVMGLVPLLMAVVVSSWMRRALPVLVALVSVLSVGCRGEDQKKISVPGKLFGSVTVIGTRGMGAGRFNKPRSLVLDRNDNLYVADMTGRVQKFDQAGVFVTSWQLPQTDLGKPKGMCLDRDGNIVVVEPHYMRVNHFSTDGKLLFSWGRSGTNAGDLSFPRDVEMNSRGDLFVSEYGKTERIQSFDPRGQAYRFGFGNPGDKAGQFSRVEGIGIDSGDSIYAADSCNHRVQVFSRDGKFSHQFGSAGDKPGQVSYPMDVCVDRAGNVFVCEFGNSRVQIFTRDGISTEILGHPGGSPGEMSNPWSIALDSKGNLYVADSINHRVQKFHRREPLTTAASSPSVQVVQR